MIRTKLLIFIKLLLLIGAIFLAGCLILVNKKLVTVRESTVIILDVSTDMNTQDIQGASPSIHVTRMNAAKKIITKIISDYPQHLFGLITYGHEITYLIPPTLDSGTLLQYANNLVIGVQNVEGRVQNGVQSGSKTSEPGTLNPELASEPGTLWTTGLIATLQDKNSIVLGDITLPKALLQNAQTIPLNSYKSFNPALRDSLTPFSRVSTVQTQLLTILLCIIAILLL